MAKKKTFSFAHLIGRGATASEEEEDKKAKKAKGRRAEEDEREDDAEDDEREDDAEDDERDDDAEDDGDDPDAAEDDDDSEDVDFEISGISDAGSETTAAIADAIDGVLFESANPLGTGKIYLSDLNRAIGDVAGTAGFILVSPSVNIEPGIGELAVRGEVNYT